MATGSACVVADREKNRETQSRKVWNRIGCDPSQRASQTSPKRDPAARWDLKFGSDRVLL